MTTPSMMKGGRVYADLMKQLAAEANITFLKGIEAYELVKKQTGKRLS